MSTYTQFLFNKYKNVFNFPCDFLNNIFFSLAYLIVGIQYIGHITYKICVYVIGKAFDNY